MVEWSKLVPELVVSDFATSLRFYTEGIGFTILWVRQEPDFAYLDFAGAQLMLEAWQEDGWNVGVLARPYGRGINMQIECADAQGLRDRLVAQGYSLYRDLQDSWYAIAGGLAGQRQFLIQDPDGYLLRFAEPLGERVA